MSPALSSQQGMEWPRASVSGNKPRSRLERGGLLPQLALPRHSGGFFSLQAHRKMLDAMCPADEETGGQRVFLAGPLGWHTFLQVRPDSQQTVFLAVRWTNWTPQAGQRHQAAGGPGGPIWMQGPSLRTLGKSPVSMNQFRRVDRNSS